MLCTCKTASLLPVHVGAGSVLTRALVCEVMGYFIFGADSNTMKTTAGVSISTVYLLFTHVLRHPILVPLPPPPPPTPTLKKVKV